MTPRFGLSTSYSISNGDIIRLWILRAVVLLDGHKGFIGDHGFDDDNIALEVGLEKWINDDDEMMNFRDRHKEIRRDLRNKLSEKEEWVSDISAPDTLVSNIDKLGQILHLNSTEKRLLEFAILIHTEPMLSDAVNWIGDVTLPKLCTCLSVLLQIKDSEIKEALSRNATLARSGILSVDLNTDRGVKAKLDFISSSFAEQMLVPIENPLFILRETILQCSSPTLSLSDFNHIKDSLEILIPYMKYVTQTHRKGVNIFIHGEPGTGKSQLSRILAEEMSLQLFEISREDENGDAIDATTRLRAFRAAQSMFSTQSSLLLFDEIEDVFNDGAAMFGMKSTAQTHKGWINSTLEENPVPTLWLTNDVRNMDPAFIRRFDMVIELTVPPLQKRRMIVADMCSDILPESSINKIAAHEQLTPAIVARASSVISAIRDKLPDAAVHKSLEHLVEKTLMAQGHHSLSQSNSIGLPSYYDPDFVNTNINLNDLKAGISHSKSGRLCMYGPPGTGKTAYARWLAEELDMPIHIKRASDLISMWVGGTEKAIARAFKDAASDNAMLVIDEIDSFLQDRRGATHSWEVTAVNEMLTQMEVFSGIFVASTNLVDGLDQASLRRFDLKLKFDYLLPEQAWKMFVLVCKEAGLEHPDNSLQKPINRLSVLTPGDFATVSRRHRFSRFDAPSAVLLSLEEECAFKEDGKRRPIGFV